MKIVPVNTDVTSEMKQNVMVGVKESTVQITTTNEVTNTVSLTPVGTVNVPVADNETVIGQFFAANGFKILEHSFAPEITGLRQLTLFIGDNYATLSDFIRSIKTSICHPTVIGERKVVYNLKTEELSSVTHLCKLFKKYGLFTENLCSQAF